MIITSFCVVEEGVFSISLLLLGALFAFPSNMIIRWWKNEYIAQEQAISHYLYTYYLKHGKIDEAYLDAQNVSLITDKGTVVQIETLL